MEALQLHGRRVDRHQLTVGVVRLMLSRWRPKADLRVLLIPVRHDSLDHLLFAQLLQARTDRDAMVSRHQLVAGSARGDDPALGISFAVFGVLHLSVEIATVLVLVLRSLVLFDGWRPREVCQCNWVALCVALVLLVFTLRDARTAEALAVVFRGPLVHLTRIEDLLVALSDTNGRLSATLAHGCDNIMVG